MPVSITYRLLTKNPKKRLAWPAVSDHPFISGNITQRSPIPHTLAVPGKSPRTKRSPRKTAPRKPSATPGRKPLLGSDVGRTDRGSVMAISKTKSKSKAKGKLIRSIGDKESESGPLPAAPTSTGPTEVVNYGEAGPAASTLQQAVIKAPSPEREVTSSRAEDESRSIGFNKVTQSSSRGLGHQGPDQSPTCPELVALATQYDPALSRGVALLDDPARKQLRAVVSAHLACTTVPMPGFTHDDLRSAFMVCSRPQAQSYTEVA